MELTLLNYNGDKTVVDIGNIEDIARMDIEIVSGDEILEVVRKDFTKASVASDCAFMSFYDGEYKIYDITDGTSLINDPKWLNRKSSYVGLDYAIYGEE